MHANKIIYTCKKEINDNKINAMLRHQEQTRYNGHPCINLHFFPLFFLILIAEVIIVKAQTIHRSGGCHYYCEVDS